MSRIPWRCRRFGHRWARWVPVFGIGDRRRSCLRYRWIFGRQCPVSESQLLFTIDVPRPFRPRGSR
ncbi:MAG: hypothetical protein ACRDH8_15435 [Actinomycetota bacterium]